MKILDAGSSLECHGTTTLDICLDIPVDVKQDLNQFPYPFFDKQFDRVFCSHTLEHLRFPERALDEFVRISNVVEVWVPHQWSMTAKRDKSHLHTFNIAWFQNYAKSRGLRVQFRTMFDVERLSWKTPFCFQLKVWLWRGE